MATSSPEAGWQRGVDSTQPLDTDSGVALRCLETSRPEHLGDVSDVRSTFEHQGGHAVTEQVAAASLVGSRLGPGRP